MFEMFKKHREIVKEIKNLDDNEKEYLYSALNIHGHLCGGMPMGYLAGLAAMKLLNVTREINMDKMVVVHVGDKHAGGCFADGVQFATGCTFGKGIMNKDPKGKWALTLVDKKSKKAVKVTVKPEIINAAFQSEFITKYRKQGIPPAEVDPEVSIPTFLNLFSKKLEDIVYATGPFDYTIDETPSSFNIGFCEKCGDAVAENYLRVENGNKVCLDCFSYSNSLK